MFFLDPQNCFDEQIAPVESNEVLNVKYNRKIAICKTQRKPKKSKSARSVAKLDSVVTLANRKQIDSKVILTRHAFPSFDRSDATIYFASIFARMSNNGDEEGLKKLITTHCAKDIEVLLREGRNETQNGRFCVPLAMFLDMLAIGSNIWPDMMTCMHSTKVDGNKIVAVLYSKNTDAAEMHDYRSCVVETKYQPLFCGRRKQLFIRNMGLDDLDESKRNAVLKLLDMNVDVELYHRVEITLTLHDRTKKVVDFKYLSRTTSVYYDGVHYPTV